MVITEWQSTQLRFSLSFSSSLRPSPLHPPLPCKNITLNFNSSSLQSLPGIRCALTSSSSSSATATSPSSSKKKHWKQGEHPGLILHQDSSKRRTPIKNIAKKLERKKNASAWVNTVTEALSDAVDKKLWLRALEVILLCSAFSRVFWVPVLLLAIQNVIFS